jgi:hypothetical protein
MRWTSLIDVIDNFFDLREQMFQAELDYVPVAVPRDWNEPARANA